MYLYFLQQLVLLICGPVILIFSKFSDPVPVHDWLYTASSDPLCVNVLAAKLRKPALICRVVNQLPESWWF